MADFMSNAELDAKMDEADKKRRKTKLSVEDKLIYGKQILNILNKKAPLLTWKITEMPKDFDKYVEEGNRKVKENNIYVRGSFIHPKKGEMAAISAIPIGLVPVDWLVEDVAEGYNRDYKRKMNS